MIEKQLSASMGVFLAFLTLLGFGTSDKRRAKFMNVDTSHSVLRVPLTLALLYAGTKSDLKTTRNILTGVGAFYIVMGLVGLKDRKVGGALPSGLTNFDIIYHFVVGAEALWFGTRPGRMVKP